jgi:hypothetical protein
MYVCMYVSIHRERESSLGELLKEKEKKKKN